GPWHDADVLGERRLAAKDDRADPGNRARDARSRRLAAPPAQSRPRSPDPQLPGAAAIGQPPSAADAESSAPAADHQSGSATASFSRAASAAARSANRAKQVAPLPLIRAMNAPGSAASRSSTAPISGTSSRAASVRSLWHDASAAASPAASGGTGPNRPAGRKGPRRR